MNATLKKYPFAQIALNLPLQKTFQYEIPASLRENMKVGDLVLVPFRNRTAIGCVVKLDAKKQFDVLKQVIRIVTQGFSIPPKIIKLAKWISDYYFCGVGEALACASFVGFNEVKHKTRRFVLLHNFPLLSQYGFDLAVVYPDKKFTKKQMEVIDYFLESKNTPIELSKIRAEGILSVNIINRLLKEGILTETFATVWRKDDYEVFSPPSDHIALNEEQQIAFDAIKSAIDNRRYESFLLHGVTGSGKTEVYLQAIDEGLKAGRQAVVLVPEISLTPQTVDRFRSRFKEIVGVYHSRLTLGEKFDLYRKIESGEIKIVIGARSAVFTPFDDLGLIVIDEEHETTFKQSDDPRYNTQDVAVMRAKNQDAVVILGSATPSLESYYNTEIGKFSLLSLPHRINKVPLPEVELIDMRLEAREHKSSDLISTRLESEIRSALSLGEQVMILKNRRGFSNFVLCMSCDNTIKCDSCDVTMTYHKNIDSLLCHYCGKTKAKPASCPSCGKEGIALLGSGTEQVEDELSRKFPDAKILRLDLDTTSFKRAFSEHWKEIVEGNCDIILGTQMIAKGFHIENLTLVGVLSADQQLFLPDFRVAERTFSLLTQVAGRAGRGEKRGQVFIQTYMPNHYAIQHAKNHDFNSFYQREIRCRKLIKFPPFFKVALITFSHPDRELARAVSRAYGSIVRRFSIYEKFDRVDVLGPVTAPISKIKNKYRWRILLRAKHIHSIDRLLKSATKKFEDSSIKGKNAVAIAIDINPKNML